MPISPLRPMTPQAWASKLCQLPLKATTAQSMNATINMRQRVNAKAPKWRDGITAMTLPSAQQAAAPRASRSWRHQGDIHPL